jgi:hypothetical protein
MMANALQFIKPGKRHMALYYQPTRQRNELGQSTTEQ